MSHRRASLEELLEARLQALALTLAELSQLRGH